MFKTSLSRTTPPKRKQVTFNKSVAVRELPESEAEAAEETRRGLWECAPDHDELWDGHNGFAFFALIANFRRRREQLKLNYGEEEFLVPKFDTLAQEETAIRKEIRELFADSVKGLDFQDLVEDRETFDKLYANSVPVLKLSDEASLRLTEKLVDDVLYCEEMCEILHVKFQTIRSGGGGGNDRSRNNSRLGQLVSQERKRPSVADLDGRAMSRSIVLGGEEDSRERLESLDLGHVTAKRRGSMMESSPPSITTRRSSIVITGDTSRRSSVSGRMPMLKEEEIGKTKSITPTTTLFATTGVFISGMVLSLWVWRRWGWRRALAMFLFMLLVTLITAVATAPSSRSKM
ncbi:hypothetical protein BASA81_015865 [Batrachochytrium salamandrivorans]|nr:hypothetical protein BASA81_015865 [Batrachochytrium salamandrivorans]